MWDAVNCTNVLYRSTKGQLNQTKHTLIILLGILRLCKNTTQLHMREPDSN